MTRAELDAVIWTLHVPMLRLAASILRHPQNAEDAVSTAVVTAYQKVHMLRDDGAVKPWLMQITARSCYDMLRKRKREILLAEPMPADVGVFCEPVEDKLYHKIVQLAHGQAQVLLLYYYDGFSVAEIAGILGLARPTVSMRMSRGREKLREMLLEEEREDCDA